MTMLVESLDDSASLVAAEAPAIVALEDEVLDEFVKGENPFSGNEVTEFRLLMMAAGRLRQPSRLVA